VQQLLVTLKFCMLFLIVVLLLHRGTMTRGDCRLFCDGREQSVISVKHGCVTAANACRRTLARVRCKMQLVSSASAVSGTTVSPC